MFTTNSNYAAANMNNNFLKTDRAVLDMQKTFADLAAKADVVPLDFRNLTTANQQLLMDKVIGQMSPADQAKLLIMR